MIDPALTLVATIPIDATRFLRALDPNASSFTFQTFDDDRSREDPHLAKILHGSLTGVSAKLERLIAKGAGVHVTINETDGRGRKRANIVRVRALFVDDVSLELVRQSEPKPHIITESSPGRYHAYWRVEGVTLEEFSSMQLALIKRFGSDPNVHSLEHVMRLPGFMHRKGTPFQSRIVSISDHSAYSSSKFERAHIVPRTSNGDLLADDPLFAEAALAVIPNDDLEHYKWNNIGMAIWSAFDGSDRGKAAFHAFSRKSGKYDEHYTNERWGGITRSPPNKIGMGSLAYHADQTGTNWRDAYDEAAIKQINMDADKPPEFSNSESGEPPKETKVKYPLIIELARRLWGEPTTQSKDEVRFGNKVVDSKKGNWFDFDSLQGGRIEGLMKLVARSAADSETTELHWYDEADTREVGPWLVQDLIPEVGFGLISGQAAVYKTFVALDLAAAVMTDHPFINFEMRRPGGVLFIAAEGSDTIGFRLRAAIEHKYGEGKMPFAWVTSCPQLTGPGAADELIRIATRANDRMQAKYGVPLVLVVIDTIMAAAGYEQGGENDAPTGQQVMGVLKTVARKVSCFVFGVDHFGKNKDVGTRGTSAKEAAIDVILATLGEKQQSGEVTGTKLAIRKRRTGANGIEIDYTPRVVDMGRDQHGYPMTSVIIEWGAASDDKWDKAPKLREALTAALAEHGAQFTPRNASTIKAVSKKKIREKFGESFPPKKGENKSKHTHRVSMAFKRSFESALWLKLIGAEEADNDDVLVWEIRQADPIY
jgi:AAA domain/RepB DNA-primase from phage plasmid/Primase C terminal 2 (PriCT-2)